MLAAARDEGAAVVVTTHDPGVVDDADRVVELAAPTQPPPDPEPERHPLLARVGPLALLGAALCVLPLPALLDTWRQALAVLAVEVLLGLVGLLAPGHGRAPEGRLRGVLARLAPAGLAVVGVAWSAWLLGGRDLEVAAGAALRVLCLLVPSAFVVGFLDPEGLGDHLAQRLRLPARPVVAATAALQRLQSFDTLWGELMTTRRVRGIRADRGAARPRPRGGRRHGRPARRRPGPGVGAGARHGRPGLRGGPAPHVGGPGAVAAARHAGPRRRAPRGRRRGRGPADALLTS